MTPTLSVTDALALLGAMALLAALPSVSVLAVTTRAAASGVAAGAAVAAGVVTGDLLFILVALLGLTAVAELAGGWSTILRVAGGLYLLWLGIGLWRASGQSGRPRMSGRFRTTDFVTGLLVTLGDQKAILFYLGFFPAFVNTDALTGPDVAVVAALAVLSVGGVKLAYAVGAARAGAVPAPGTRRLLSRVAGVMLVGLGMSVGASAVLAP